MCKKFFYDSSNSVRHARTNCCLKNISTVDRTERLLKVCNVYLRATIKPSAFFTRFERFVGTSDGSILKLLEKSINNKTMFLKSAYSVITIKFSLTSHFVYIFFASRMNNLQFQLKMCVFKSQHVRPSVYLKVFKNSRLKNACSITENACFYKCK